MKAAAPRKNPAPAPKKQARAAVAKKMPDANVIAGLMNKPIKKNA